MKTNTLSLRIEFAKCFFLLTLMLFLTTVASAQGGAAINTTGATSDSSAILDLSSNNRGLLIPRMTTNERNAIVNPAIGLQIFNTTTMCFEYFAYGLWQTMSCAVCPTPASPSAGLHNLFIDQIEWHWSGVSGATGYKYNTINDYNSSTDCGLNTSYTQTGLSCNSAYTLYVWAYNNCGNSASSTLTASTSACPVWNCGDPLVVSHIAGSVAPVNKTVSYGTVSTSLSGASKCWITQNLGADNQATSATDNTETAAGWYWQFGYSQGYKHDGVTRTPNTAWITSITGGSDWSSANDPCTLLLGASWRIPTRIEWMNADNTWSNFNDAYSSVLKIHTAGLLKEADGTLFIRGSWGCYWTSTNYTNTTGYFYYNASTASDVSGNAKPNGNSIRCIMD